MSIAIGKKIIAGAAAIDHTEVVAPSDGFFYDNNEFSLNETILDWVQDISVPTAKVVGSTVIPADLPVSRPGIVVCYPTNDGDKIVTFYTKNDDDNTKADAYYMYLAKDAQIEEVEWSATNAVTSVPVTDKVVYLTGTTSSDENTDIQAFDPQVYLAKEPGTLVASTLVADKVVGDLDGTVAGHTVEANVPADAAFTDTVVQSDWNEDDDTADAYIKNKPTSMPASDVYDWAKAENRPTYTAADVGADPAGAAETAKGEATAYTDQKIADLINSAPTTLDTLGEIAEAMKDNQDVVEALDEAIGQKASSSDLTDHTNNKENPHGTTKTHLGLDKVENKSSEDIRAELTKENVTTALGYTPPETDTDTTYTAGDGLELEGTEFKHSNSITAGTVKGDNDKVLSFGGTFTIPSITYDGQGHITNTGITTMTLPDAPSGGGSTVDAVFWAIPFNGSIVLHWKRPEGDVFKYRIQKLIAAEDGTTSWTTIVYPAAEATSYTDTGLTNGVVYQYRLLYYTADGTDAITLGSAKACPGDITIDADTLDGLHTTDFVNYYGTSITDTDMLNNANWTGAPYEGVVNSTNAPTIGLAAHWWHIKFMRHVDGNGYGVQIAFPLNSTTSVPVYRTSSTTEWGDWQNFRDGGAAATLATARTIDGVSFNGSAAITHYATCSTAAGTAAKTVACTGFTLATGAWIAVRFTNTNTAASPTLNVNSTGAKAIRYRDAVVSAGVLAAGRTYLFIYNGSSYELVGDLDTNTTYSAATTSANGLMPSTDKAKLGYTNIAYGTCSTAAATAAKVVTITGNSNWTLAVGSIIFVKFTATNTASSVTLNVNSTGAKSIWYNNAAYTGASSTACGYANRYHMYIYDGTYWVWMGYSLDANTWTAASASVNGYVSTGTQTFAGAKTFNGIVKVAGATAAGTSQVRNLAAGTAAATTTNCPSGALYGQYK